MARPAVVVACLLVLIVGLAHAAVIGIDFGSEWIKVGLAKPGVPLAIINNEQSKRKDPALVGFAEGERVAGESALTASSRRPETVFAHLKSVLGQPFRSDAADRLRSLGFAYDLVETSRGTIGFKVGDETYSAEELVGMLLSHVREFADVAAGTPIRDCVITVPVWYTQAARRALEDAAHLAGLNLLSLMHDHAAVALQYGIQGGFARPPHTVLFVDVGAAAAQAAVVRYNETAPTRPGDRPVSALHVLSTASDTGTGGAWLDAIVTDMLREQWNAKHRSLDLGQSPRALTRLRRQATRTKEVLSANTETPVYVESLLSGTDLVGHATRAELEARAAPELQRVTAVVQQAVQAAGLRPSELDGVVLVGGGSRVPVLKQALMKELGRDELNLTLNADEAAALGACFFAARLSPSLFRVKPVHVFDTCPHSLVASIDGVPEPTLSFAAGSRIPTRHTAEVRRGDDFVVEVAYGADALPHLPRGTPAAVAAFQVQGVATAAAALANGTVVGTPTVRVQLRVAHDGVAQLVQAEVVLGDQAQKEPPPSPPLSESSVGETADGVAGAAGNDTEAAPASSSASEASTGGSGGSGGGATATDPGVKPLRKLRAPVAVHAVTRSVAWLSDEERAAAVRRLRSIEQREQLRRRTADARNALEALIYAAREEMASDAVQAVSTEEQRSAVDAALSEADAWLWDEGAEAALEAYEAKRRDLLAKLAPVRLRVTERQRRPGAVAAAQQTLADLLNRSSDWATRKPHLTEAERTDLATELEAVRTWLDEQTAAQEQRAPHEDPAFTTDQLRWRLDRVTELFNRLDRKRAPPPPKPKAGAGKTDGKTGAGSGGSGSGSGDRASEGTAGGSAEGGGAESGASGDGGGAAADGADERTAAGGGGAAGGAGGDTHDEL